MKSRVKQIMIILTALCLAPGAVCFTTACRSAATADDEVAQPAISEQAAIQSAAELIEDVFSVTVDTDQMRAESIYEDWYTVFVDRSDGDGCDYSAFVDNQTGEVLNVSRNYDSLTLTDEQRETAEAYLAQSDGAADNGELIDVCTPIAQALVERVFADGRTVTQTEFGSIMTDSEMTPTQEVAICVRMDEGACYTVEVVWPQAEVFSASVYPLGWHSCIYGYDDSDEADEYPPLED